MDLDFAMLLSFPKQYNVSREDPSSGILKAVLGKENFDSNQYSKEELKLFDTYHKRFKLGSKPAAHIEALAHLTDQELAEGLPESLSHLADSVIAKLKELPE